MAMKKCPKCGKPMTPGHKCKGKQYRALAALLAAFLLMATPVVAPVAAGELGWCEDCD